MPSPQLAPPDCTSRLALERGATVVQAARAVTPEGQGLGQPECDSRQGDAALRPMTEGRAIHGRAPRETTASAL